MATLFGPPKLCLIVDFFVLISNISNSTLPNSILCTLFKTKYFVVKEFCHMNINYQFLKLGEVTDTRYFFFYSCLVFQESRRLNVTPQKSHFKHKFLFFCPYFFGCKKLSFDRCYYGSEASSSRYANSIFPPDD